MDSICPIATKWRRIRSANSHTQSPETGIYINDVIKRDVDPEKAERGAEESERGDGEDKA